MSTDIGGHQATSAPSLLRACCAAGPTAQVKLELIQTDVLSRIIRAVSSDLSALPALRLTCRSLRAAVDANVEVVNVRDAPVGWLGATFPRVTDIDLSGCSAVQDRFLQLLVAPNGRPLPLRRLGIGSALLPPTCCRPLITDKALRSLAAGHLRGLRSLSVCGCPGISDVGVAALAVLTELTSLRLVGCPQISDAGLRPLLCNATALREVALGGHKVTDASLALLPALRALRLLHLCGTSATDPGLACTLSRLAPLQELVLSWAHVSPATLGVLGTTHGALRALCLLECGGSVPSVVLAAAAQLTALTRLHLHSLGQRGCALHPSALQSLTLAQPPGGLQLLEDISLMGGGPRGLLPARSLAHLPALLPALRCVSVGAWPWGNREACHLTALSGLTQLTRLQVKWAPLGPAEGRARWMAVLRSLPMLQSLDLSHSWDGHDGSGGGGNAPAEAMGAVFRASGDQGPSARCRRRRRGGAAGQRGGGNGSSVISGGGGALHASALCHLQACSRLRELDLSFAGASPRQLRTLLCTLPPLRVLVVHGVGAPGRAVMLEAGRSLRPDVTLRVS